MLDGRQREALVQRRHDRDLGAGQQFGELVVADAADELDLAVQREVGQQPRGRAVRRELADEDQLGVPLGDQLRVGPQQRGDALHRRVRARDRDHPAGHPGRGTRVEQPGVDAQRNHLDVLRRHLEVPQDVGLG